MAETAGKDQRNANSVNALILLYDSPFVEGRRNNPWMAGTRLVLGPASPVPSAGHDDREVKWSAASDRRR
jgi:hypothetical protein